MIRWVRTRHENGFVYYEGYDIDKSMMDTRVATIYPSDAKGCLLYTSPSPRD